MEKTIFILAQLLLQSGVDGVEEFFGVEEILSVFDVVAVDTDSEVFGHFAAFDGLDADGFEGVGEVDEGLVVVELAAKGEAAGPRENAGDGVGGGWFAGLVVS